jgi:DNA-binding response OmpR family regulator
MKTVLRTLVIDDEEGIRFFLQEALCQGGYAVETASSGEEALDILKGKGFDLIVLDLKLGGRVDGQRVLEMVRWRWPETVVVILTAYGSLESALDAIEEGVDGYLLKPAKQADVLCTLQAAWERRQKQVRRMTAREEEHLLQRGPFSFDLRAQQFTLRGQPIALTLHESRLLVHLMQHAHQAISAEELVNVVLQYEAEGPYQARRAIKWYVHCLRRKVEADPASPCHILNVRGIGYMFKEGA